MSIKKAGLAVCGGMIAAIIAQVLGFNMGDWQAWVIMLGLNITAAVLLRNMA